MVANGNKPTTSVGTACGSERARRKISTSAMRAPPPRFVVESFFVPLNAFPAQEMRLIVGADRFNHVTGYAIAAFTATNHLFLTHRFGVSLPAGIIT